jgi:hypothetical protein
MLLSVWIPYLRGSLEQCLCLVIAPLGPVGLCKAEHGAQHVWLRFSTSKQILEFSAFLDGYRPFVDFGQETYMLEAQVKAHPEDGLCGMENLVQACSIMKMNLRPWQKTSGSFSPWMGSTQMNHRGELQETTMRRRQSAFEET